MALDLPTPVHLPPHSDARVPPRPAPPPAPRRLPQRPLLLGVFLVALVAGCAFALRSGSGDAGRASPRRASSAAVPSTTSTPTTGSVTVDVAVGDTTGCQRLAGTEPQLLCPLPEGVVEYTQVASPMTAYRGVAGADDAVAARGESACATGSAEERAWSRPQAPATEVGRYLCRVVDDRAELWWTVDDAGLLGHAYRRDDNLVALFSWWRSRTEGGSDHP